MSKTCLELIQTAAERMGLNAPSAALSSTNKTTKQLLALSIEHGNDLCRHPWTALQLEATFTTIASEYQCKIANITDNFGYIVNDTIWNRSLRRPVYGPRSQQTWQQQKAMQLNGPFHSFRIKEGEIHFYPAPSAGLSCAFEYISNGWVLSNGYRATTWLADIDTCYLDDELMILGIIYRFRQANGLDFSDAFEKFQRLALDLLARDGGGEVLHMAGAKYDLIPGIFVSAGSWSVP